MPLASDADGLLKASELARQSVLNGIGPPAPSEGEMLLADLKALFAGAPQVLSLNGSPAVAPAMANAGHVRNSGGNAKVYPTMPARAPIPGVGGVYWNAPVQLGPARNSTPQRVSGPPGCGASGLSGFAPPWGDAYAPAGSDPAATGGGGVTGWIQSHPWLALLAAGAGVLALASGRKGRYGR